jgi:hypothetical protein
MPASRFGAGVQLLGAVHNLGPAPRTLAHPHRLDLLAQRGPVGASVDVGDRGAREVSCAASRRPLRNLFGLMPERCTVLETIPKAVELTSRA